MAKILVVAELGGGSLKKSTNSAITFARDAIAAVGGSFDILAMGKGAQALSAQLTGYGATNVLVTEDAYLHDYVGERYSPTVAAVVAQHGYDVVVVTATGFGKDLAPRIAARLDAGLASDVIAVIAEGAKLAFKRPMFAGNAIAVMTVTTAVTVVSCRQADFAAAAPSGGSSAVGSVAVSKQASADRVEFIGFEESTKSARPELTEASTVVSGGRALKSAEGFKTVLEPLVDAFGAAMGASRAACDAGYVPNDLQVGQTGKVVAPKLYVAVGISGAIQHLAGMKNSKVIVAINKDAEAPIFQVADYGLVADLFKVVPELAQAIKQAKSE
jgi:electron transfer flavoprotein alpha subunit